MYSACEWELFATMSVAQEHEVHEIPVRGESWAETQTCLFFSTCVVVTHTKTQTQREALS